MLLDNFNSMVITTCIETKTYNFSKQKHKLSNCKTPRVSRHVLARIFMLLKPDTVARGRLGNNNQLQKSVLLLNKDNLQDSVQPRNFNTAHINFKRPMKSYSTCHLGLSTFYWDFLS